MGRVTSSHSPAGTRSDLAAGLAADEHRAVADQLGRPGPGQAEHPGERGVQALAVQAVRNGNPALARRGHPLPPPDGRSCQGCSGCAGGLAG